LLLEMRLIFGLLLGKQKVVHLLLQHRGNPEVPKLGLFAALLPDYYKPNVESASYCFFTIMFCSFWSRSKKVLQTDPASHVYQGKRVIIQRQNT